MGELKVGKLSETQCAWLAACLDTDGWIALRISKNERPIPKYKLVKNPRSNFRIRPIIGISNGDIRLVKQAQRITNCGSICAKWSRNSKNPCFNWEVTGLLNVIPILHQILPYLIVKHDKAQIIFEWAETRQRTLQNKGYNRGYSKGEMDIAFKMRGIPSIKTGGMYGQN